MEEASGLQSDSIETSATQTHDEVAEIENEEYLLVESRERGHAVPGLNEDRQSVRIFLSPPLI